MVEQNEDLDQSQSDARGSQSHPSCRLWESQSDVMEVGPRMEGTPVARGREVAAQGECGKREGRDHCQPGREEKSQTEMVEVEEGRQGAGELVGLQEGDQQSGLLLAAALRTAGS